MNLFQKIAMAYWKKTVLDLIMCMTDKLNNTSYISDALRDGGNGMVIRLQCGPADATATHHVLLQ